MGRYAAATLAEAIAEAKANPNYRTLGAAALGERRCNKPTDIASERYPFRCGLPKQKDADGCRWHRSDRTTNGGRAAKENPMPETAEITFPTEALDRLRAQHDEAVGDYATPEAIVKDAMAVIEHLESDNTALRNTIDFMRQRVSEAIEPR